MKHCKTRYDSPLGPLILVADHEHLLEIQLEDNNPNTVLDPPTPPIQKTILWLNDYFAGKVPSPEALQIRLGGPAFQQEVWDCLRQIPYGQTVTYGQIAADIAKHRGIRRMSAQAVGQAVGANSIPIVIPCHRVVGSNGELIGYSSGLVRKQWLLMHEAIK